MINRVASRIFSIRASACGFHTSAHCAAVTRFNLPAMSPTMTEGTIHKWKVKEGQAFSAGDVLLELETDKAQIDVEASEDGILAKILLSEGQKAPVNSPIALLAEEGDDLNNLEIPADDQPTQAAPSKEEPASDPQPQKTAAPMPSKPMDHHDIDTSKLKKPLSPAVLSLVLKHHITDLGAIKASGPGGRILKGDVLAHLGLIKPKPAPPIRTSIAPPRDQIQFAKPAETAPAKKTKTPLPNYISKDIIIDELLALRHELNAKHGTAVSVNDFLGKAATRALQDVAKPGSVPASKTGGVVYKTDAAAFATSYRGGSFKIFHLAQPTYDFITDDYEPAKPYELQVGASRPLQTRPKQSPEDEMLELIGYLGGETPKVPSHNVTLTTERVGIDFSERVAPQQQVQVKLQGQAPGEILNDKNASLFLDRLEHYVRNPSELVL